MLLAANITLSHVCLRRIRKVTRQMHRACIKLDVDHVGDHNGCSDTGFAASAKPPQVSFDYCDSNFRSLRDATSYRGNVSARVEPQRWEFEDCKVRAKAATDRHKWNSIDVRNTPQK